MKIQVINFSIIAGNNTSISYSFNILDSNGAITKANIRRSLPFTAETILPAVVNTDNILEITDAIKSYLADNTTI